MEKISFYIRTSKKKNLKVNYRLREGRDIQMFHRSDIVADLADLNKFNTNGSVKGRVSIYNESLAKSLKEEYDIMCSAYTFMCDSGLDVTTEIFEREIARIKTPVVAIRETRPPLITRFRKYADDALKYGIVARPGTSISL